jgi:predicted metal-dependent HD superfamily phosphohydrolase
MADSGILNRAERHWRDLAARVALPAAARDALFAAYSEPHRRYHTLDHIVEMLDCLAESRHLAANPDAVSLAAWYHDVVYAADAPAGGNERASAAWLAAEYEGGESAQAQAMILHSAHHGPSDDADTRLFCDLDLYRLGVAWDEFLGHSADVRHEYRHVDDASWAMGRGAFFRGMLARDAIYQTPFWRGRLEAQARANLARAIAELDES